MASKKQINNGPTRQNNGDTGSVWKIDGEDVCCLGSFHKTLPHNEYGEVRVDAFAKLVSATRDKTGNGFPMVPPGEAPPVSNFPPAPAPTPMDICFRSPGGPRN